MSKFTVIYWLFHCIFDKSFVTNPALIGDWHVAYILLYGPQRLEKLPEDPSPAEEMSTTPPTAESSDTKDASMS